MDVHQDPTASALLAKLWLLSHVWLGIGGLIYAAFVWPEPLFAYVEESFGTEAGRS